MCLEMNSDLRLSKRYAIDDKVPVTDLTSCVDQYD